MTKLDDISSFSEYDPTDFIGVVEGLADQVRDARERAMAAPSVPAGQGVDAIAVLGMGGSGISGDVVKAVLGSSLPVPFETVRSYAVPSWVDEDTVVFAMSYSGDTEETLSAYEECRKRGARIMSITSGGKLLESARKNDVPFVEIPGGYQPRAALGYLAVPIMVVLHRMGVGPAMDKSIDESLSLLAERAQQWGRKSPSEVNPAKQLANHLLGKIPIVYGSDGLAGAAAYRWKCQLNECAKVPSWWHAFPELNHNEIVGWNRLGEITEESVAVVVLREEGQHTRTKLRIDVTVPLIEGALAYVHEVSAQGKSALARLFDLIYLGDFVSSYLAIEQGVDPAPVEIIQSLKKRLAQG